MHHIVYISTAVIPLSEAYLQELLSRWRDNNHRNGITGILLYSEGKFMQVIEGENEPLQLLFKNILVDYRHQNLIKLADGPIPQRNFSTWLMGFQLLSPEEFTKLAGYVELSGAKLQQALATTQDAVMKHLLELFAEQTSDVPFHSSSPRALRG